MERLGLFSLLFNSSVACSRRMRTRKQRPAARVDKSAKLFTSWATRAHVVEQLAMANLYFVVTTYRSLFLFPDVVHWNDKPRHHLLHQSEV